MKSRWEKLLVYAISSESLENVSCYGVQLPLMNRSEPLPSRGISLRRVKASQIQLESHSGLINSS